VNAIPAICRIKENERERRTTSKGKETTKNERGVK
jgi:hypothetical protein